MWKRAKVHEDSHIEFDGRLYSVPWLTIRKQVWVRATDSSVEVYLDDIRIATHERRGESRHSTNEHHLPEHRRDYRHRTAPYWIERADQLGAEVGAYIRSVFYSEDVVSKLRDVQAIVTLLEKHPPHRAQKAVLRAHYYGNYSYQGIKRILLNALDMQPLPTLVVPAHGQLEQPRFARSMDELLAKHMETTHEPN